MSFQLVPSERSEPHSQVRKEKVAAGLAPEDIWVTDSDVGSPMQKVLNKTVDRILIDENIVDRIEDLKHQYGQIRVELIHKFGLDGSKNHPVFKQVAPTETRDEGYHTEGEDDNDDDEMWRQAGVADKNEQRDKGACILSCLVPLQLVAILPTGEHEILWENDLMNSNLSAGR